MPAFYGVAVVCIGAAGFPRAPALFPRLGCSPSPRIWLADRRGSRMADPGARPALFKSDPDAGLILFAGLVLDAALPHLGG